MNFFDVALLRNFLCIYLINIDKVLQPRLKIPCRRYAYIFKHLRVLKLKEVLELVGRFQEFSIKAINEVFLRLIFGKYAIKEGIDLMKEIKLKNEEKIFTKLNSLKKVFAQRTTIGSYYALIRLNKKRNIIEKISKEDIEKANLPQLFEFAQNFNQKNQTKIVCSLEIFILMSIEQALALNRMVMMNDKQFDDFSDEDARKFFLLMEIKSFRTEPQIEHVQSLQKALNNRLRNGYERTMTLIESRSSKSEYSRKFSGFVDLNDPDRHQQDNGRVCESAGRDDAKSLLSESGFSFLDRFNQNKYEEISSLFKF